MSKLSKCQLFYLEQNADNQTEEQLAEDMGVSLARVKTAVKKLQKDREVVAAALANPEPEQPPKRERAKPVVMTEAMSHQYDEAQKSHAAISPKLSKSISVVDPNARIY